MRRCEGRRCREQSKWIQWNPERIRQKRQRGDLKGRFKQAFPRQPLASLTLKNILCTEKLTFKKCMVSPPWWWRNYHKDHTASQSEWSSCGEHCVEALTHFITFNLLRKSIYSAVLTDFLEAKSHWSAPSLQADFHDLFSKKQSREKGLSEIHYSDLYNKKEIGLADIDGEYYWQEREKVLIGCKRHGECHSIFVPYTVRGDRNFRLCTGWDAARNILGQTQLGLVHRVYTWRCMFRWWRKSSKNLPFGTLDRCLRYWLIFRLHQNLRDCPFLQGR